ncbi:uncharacterized protein EI97DRAFT_437473 [Westerdykella ornata]|uniref:Uncharacterized protein n=1 Tax=Westerdykella ornata TaxID=318751 RepID=A0A6A6J5W3_WESOR|nr:uncharacterized protein EI97DRAFT_437473 [Westerdykella ornata]KAF2271782.1 hypothetical protein EI97DRAFT_437473 [Westerdykella ornata]
MASDDTAEPDQRSQPQTTTPAGAITPTAAPPPAVPAASTITSPPTSTSRQPSRTSSRRTSQIYPMSPPPLPLASPAALAHGSPSPHASSTTTTHAFPPLSPSLMGHSTLAQGTGYPGEPLRHPRPLTAAELHLQLEKEQEAVVNRLTRELTALRAHSASVASTASSTSLLNDASLLDHTHPAPPHTTRRHRGSSSSRSGVLQTPQTGTVGNHVSGRSAGGSVVSTPRYEEVAFFKQELEEARRENEGLKKRIRELEGLLREKRDRGREREREREEGSVEGVETSTLAAERMGSGHGDGETEGGDADGVGAEGLR